MALSFSRSPSAVVLCGLPKRELRPTITAPVMERLVEELARRYRYVVLDIGSTNLTRVNGEVVAERELRHGDEVRFGRARCVFLSSDGDDPVAEGV